MAVLTCKNLTMYYDNHLAVKNASFSIEKGDYICIVGENGSGKSTLIKGILGLMKAKSGSIILGDGIRQNEIGYLPQQTVVQRDFPASVFEVVLSGCLNKSGLRPFYSQKEKEIATANINKLGMKHLKNKSYRELSGGQQQRVLLARALCATENILLLDEPVSGLDPIVTCEMYNLIKKLNSENGVTIIMVSHDISSAIENSDKILHMDTEVLFFGKTSDYVSSDTGARFLRGKSKC